VRHHRCRLQKHLQGGLESIGEFALAALLAETPKQLFTTVGAGFTRSYGVVEEKDNSGPLCCEFVVT
jgi:hypothetical protein